MENLELTSEEKKELEKRGFYVKKNSAFISFLKSCISSILILDFFGGLSYLLLYNKIEMIYLNYFFGITGILLLAFLLYSYIFVSSSFYFSSGIIGFGKVGTSRDVKGKVSLISMFYNLGLFLYKPIQIGFRMADAVGRLSRKSGQIFAALLLIPFLIIFSGVYHFMGIFLDWEDFIVMIANDPDAWSLFIVRCLSGIIIQFFLGFTICIGALLINYLINISHPLYAFGNLGEKIQKLTPEIEKESKIIQVEFERDQNFSVLHSGFGKLSSTFSTLISLVVRLEKIESRANKGNLFDSEKYINSLRGDIVNPLVELKKFLEKQRGQLVESQRELSRVRVGGGEERGNTELSSQRSEIILGELDENIERLEEMIGKL